MDLLLLLVGIVAAVFAFCIMFSDDLKMVEKIVGSAIFGAFTIICFGSVLVAGVMVEKAVHVSYEDKWTQTYMEVGEDGTRDEKYSPTCRVTFDVDFPYTVFFGEEYIKDFRTECSLLNDTQVALINRMIVNYKE